MSEVKKYFYVPDFGQFETMEACLEKYPSGMLVAHHTVLDELRDAKDQLELSKPLYSRRQLEEQLDQLKKENEELKAEERRLQSIANKRGDELSEYYIKLNVAIQALEKCKIVCEQQNFDTESGMLGEAFNTLTQLRGEKC